MKGLYDKNRKAHERNITALFSLSLLFSILYALAFSVLSGFFEMGLIVGALLISMPLIVMIVLLQYPVMMLVIHWLGKKKVLALCCFVVIGCIWGGVLHITFYPPGITGWLLYLNCTTGGAIGICCFLILKNGVSEEVSDVT